MKLKLFLPLLLTAITALTFIIWSLFFFPENSPTKTIEEMTTKYTYMSTDTEKTQVNTIFVMWKSRKTVIRILEALLPYTPSNVKIIIWMNKRGIPLPEFSHPRAIFMDSGCDKITPKVFSAMKYIFLEKDEDFAIFLEDDLLPVPGLWSFFNHLIPLFKDEKLFALNTFRDHTVPTHTDFDYTKLWRADVFNGLGFMISKDVYKKYILPHVKDELPKIAWDTTLIDIALEKSLYVIKPELALVKHLSPTENREKKGITVDSKFQNIMLELIVQCNQCLPETVADLDYSYQLSEEAYNEWIKKQMEGAIFLEDVNDIKKYQNQKVAIVFDGKAWNDSTSVNILTYFSVTVYVILGSRDFYKGMIRFTYASNEVFVLTATSPYVTYLEYPNRPSVGWEKPINWSDERVPSNVHPKIGEEGESCDVVCGKENETCSLNHFYYLNSDKIMNTFFSCKASKIFTIYHSKNPPSHFAVPGFDGKTCITSYSRYFNCDRSEQKTKRLCPCVK